MRPNRACSTRSALMVRDGINTASIVGRGRSLSQLLPDAILEPVHPLCGSDIDRLFDLDARHFLARLVEAQHGIIVHLEPLAVDLGFKHFRTRNDIVPEDDLLAGSPELEDGQQFTAGHEVLLDGIVHARAKHLPGIAARAVPRRNVEAVGLGAPLRIQRERHLLYPNGVVQGVPAIFRPQAVVADAHQALHADLPHAGGHAARFHRLAARQRILALDPRIAGNALLRPPGGAPVNRLLERTLLHALLVAPAAVLVDQHDAIFRPLIDRLARTGRQAAGIRAVVTDPLQVEEERLMLRQAAAGEAPRFIAREAALIDAFHQGAHRGRGVLVDIDEPPLLVRGDVADRRLT